MEVFIVASWSIWKVRNDSYFRDVVPTVDSWKLRFAKDLDMLRHRCKEGDGPLISTILDSLL